MVEYDFLGRKIINKRKPVRKSKREEIRVKQKGKCAGKCGNLLPARWHVHHKNGKKSDNRLSNLQGLCGTCHDKKHHKKDLRKKKKKPRGLFEPTLKF